MYILFSKQLFHKDLSFVVPFSFFLLFFHFLTKIWFFSLLNHWWVTVTNSKSESRKCEDKLTHTRAQHKYNSVLLACVEPNETENAPHWILCVCSAVSTQYVFVRVLLWICFILHAAFKWSHKQNIYCFYTSKQKDADRANQNNATSHSTHSRSRILPMRRRERRNMNTVWKHQRFRVFDAMRQWVVPYLSYEGDEREKERVARKRLSPRSVCVSDKFCPSEFAHE